MKTDSIFHAISWLSHKPKIRVQSVPAAEILASSEAIQKIFSLQFLHKETQSAGLLEDI